MRIARHEKAGRRLAGDRSFEKLEEALQHVLHWDTPEAMLNQVKGQTQAFIDACADKATAWETWHGHPRLPEYQRYGGQVAHGASRAGRPCHLRVAFRPLRQPKVCSIVRAMSNKREKEERMFL
jgi:hypothetical protein